MKKRMESSQAAVKYYISPKGNDEFCGSEKAPFRTLQKALRKVERLCKAGLPKGGAAIFLKGGHYEITKTITLSSHLCGTPEAPIFIESYEGERAILTGAKILPSQNFKKVTDPQVLDRILCKSAAQKLVEYDLQADGITQLGELSRRGFHHNSDGKIPQPELFIDGSKQILARFPNAGKLVYDRVIDPGSILSPEDKQGKGSVLEFDIPIKQAALWEDHSDIWADGIQSRDWSWTYNRVAEFSKDGRQIRLSTGDASDVNSWCVTRGFFFENILEEIDMEGEYYIDRAAKKLYLYPPADFNRAEICLSYFDGPIFTLGKIKNIVLSGLTLEFTRGSAVSLSEKSHQENVLFEKLEIGNIGGNGIELNGENNIVRDCHIHHIGQTAVSLRGGDSTRLIPAGNLVENNYIHDTGIIEKVYRPAVRLQGVGQIVRGNLIKNAPHVGLILNGNDHLIEYNEFYNIMSEFRDMGIIYVFTGSHPNMRGTRIANNYFHHYQPAQIESDGRAGNWAVHLDNGTQGVLTENNYFSHSQAGGINYHGGGYNQSYGNLFYDIALPMNFSNFFLAGWAYKVKSVYKNYEGFRNVRDQYTKYDAGTGRYRLKEEYSAYAKYKGFEEFLSFTDEELDDLLSVKEVEELSADLRSSIRVTQPMSAFNGNTVYNKEVSLVAGDMIKLTFFDGENRIEIKDNVQEKSLVDVHDFKKIQFQDIGPKYEEIPSGKTLSRLEEFKTLYPFDGQAAVSCDGDKARVVEGHPGTPPSLAGVYLIWQKRFGGDIYEVELSRTQDFSEGVTVFRTGRCYQNVGVLEPGVKYYWRVKAKSLCKDSREEKYNGNGITAFITAK